MVHAPWLKQWKKWVHMKLVKKNYHHINYVQDELEREYPGPISNQLLLKDYSKYYRDGSDPTDPTDFVLKTKASEGRDYKLLPRMAWEVISKRFPAALEIVRHKDPDSFLRKFNIKFPKVKIRNNVLTPV